MFLTKIFATFRKESLSFGGIYHMSTVKTEEKILNVSVKDAARILGKSEQFIRIGLQRNLLPIGTAVKMSSKWTYHISPKLLKDYAGVELDELN